MELSRSRDPPFRTLRGRRTRGDCDSKPISIPREDAVLVVWLVATRAEIIEAVPPGPVAVLLPGEKSVPEHRQTRQRNGFLANWLVTARAYLRRQSPPIIGHERRVRVALGLFGRTVGVLFAKSLIVVQRITSRSTWPVDGPRSLQVTMTLADGDFFLIVPFVGEILRRGRRFEWHTTDIR